MRTKSLRRDLFFVRHIARPIAHPVDCYTVRCCADRRAQGDTLAGFSLSECDTAIDASARATRRLFWRARKNCVNEQGAVFSIG